MCISSRVLLRLLGRREVEAARVCRSVTVLIGPDRRTGSGPAAELASCCHGRGWLTRRRLRLKTTAARPAGRCPLNCGL